MTDLKLVVPDGAPDSLPGLEPAAGRPVSSLERAVRTTLATLDTSEANAGRMALAVELAQIIDLKRASKRVSTVSNDARVLMDLLTELSPPAPVINGGVADAMAAWSEVVNRVGPPPA